jgi:hypothetical protein
LVGLSTCFLTFICIVERREGNNQPLVLKKGMAGITARFFDRPACRQAGLLANKMFKVSGCSRYFNFLIFKIY